MRGAALKRRGRRPLAIPAAHIAAGLAGAAVRHGVRRAGQYLARRGAARTAGAIGASALAAGGVVKYAGRKRRGSSAGGVAKVRRIRSGRSQAEFNGVVKSSFVMASQPYVGAALHRMRRMSTCVRILRWQAVNGMNRAGGVDPIPGWTALANNVVAGPPGYTNVPMHLINLTNTVNTTNTANGPVYRTFVNDDGTLNFSNWAGRAAGTGAPLTATDWQQEYTDNYQAATTGFRYIQPEWIDVRFLLYGAKKQPTVFEISVIRFSDDYLDPLETPSNAKEVNDRINFWQGMVRPFMFNPILMVTESV